MLSSYWPRFTFKNSANEGHSWAQEFRFYSNQLRGRKIYPPPRGHRALAAGPDWPKEFRPVHNHGQQSLLQFLNLAHICQVNSREGTQLTPSTENWIKDLLSTAPPIRTRPSSPSVSLSHQEAFISLLSFSIRRQTDWKPQSQKTNQSDHMDHSLV